MSNKKYTPDQIAAKEFQIVPNGFRAEEVDAFIDELNEQIENQIDQINSLTSLLESKSEELEYLKKDNEKIKNEINKIQTQDINEVKNTFSTKQVLKRLANIENKMGAILEIVGKENK